VVAAREEGSVKKHAGIVDGFEERGAGLGQGSFCYR
jgi:hypothetical protein